MSRQFTDGEIVAAIKALAAEGARLTRASVRKRLGGGGSTRISAILKDYSAGAPGERPRSGPTTVQIERSGPDQSGPSRSGPATGPAAAPVEVPDKLAVSVSESSSAPSPAVDGPEGCVAQLQSEIRVLKILLESERNARREDEARHCRTIEALQREIEVVSSGWSGRGVRRADGSAHSREAGSKTTS